VSIAVTLPGAAAATCVNMASEMSKWLLECESLVMPYIWPLVERRVNFIFRPGNLNIARTAPRWLLRPRFG